ncbi:MAG: Gfo/Idh/MocA family oxidoreductase [Bdellovibrionaceae bacterium]|nr:Gfo/Idh/MocA family oxidoreductase [Pseudobdellovibrionaceae bacterium]MDW8189681.1 Gfo/Idh/MocA family oxidoreductase [Pseudobdellovibrionaceae bacterium]
MLKSGVIGVGKLGTFHAEKHVILQREFPLRFLGVFDLDRDRAQNCQKFLKHRYDVDIKCYHSAEDLLGEVDLVTIATPASNHHHMVSLALKYGRHVLVEKPLALGAQLGEQLRDRALEKNLYLAVGHSERWNPAVGAIRSLVADWTPIYLEFVRHGPYQKRVTDVSVVDDLMIHDLDLFWFLFSKEMNLVSAASRIIDSQFADVAGALFEGKTGDQNTFKVYFSAARWAPQLSRMIRGFFLEGSFVADLQSLQVVYQKRGCQTEIMIFDKQDHIYLETREFIKKIIHGDGEVCFAEDVIPSLRWRDLIECYRGMS